MRPSECLCELIDTEVPADELERLARVDELLSRHAGTREHYELKLGFGELALISKSLQAAKTIGALPPQDELLDETIQVVDQALNKAV